jgi:hypothetical protein
MTIAELEPQLIKIKRYDLIDIYLPYPKAAFVVQ